MSKAEERKLIKVIFEFDNGSKSILKDRPQEWLDDINGNVCHGSK